MAEVHLAEKSVSQSSAGMALKRAKQVKCEGMLRGSAELTALHQMCLFLDTLLPCLCVDQ